ncbi:MAG: DnaB-like helicase C-terminal domain-containing protein [Acidiferrobacteraceae bacterium]
MSALRDHDAERQLLASAIEMPELLPKLLTDERLAPEHFAVETHGHAFGALVALVDRGETVDQHSLLAELERVPGIEPARVLATVTAETPDFLGMGTCAKRIRDLHRRRQIKLAAEILVDAADRGDPDRFAEAEALLTAPEESEAVTFTAEQLAVRYLDRLDSPAPRRYRWPFPSLNYLTGGGLRPKDIVLIGGWTSVGKSILYDQILEHLAEQGLRCHSYINEMSEEQRMDRTVARLSGVRFASLYSRDLREGDHSRVMEALSNVRVGLTECAGWTAPEIARHIRWNRWDVAGVDILHEIAHREERDLAEIGQVLRAAAKQAGCALIVCVHLNDNRVTSPRRPVPVLRDVRGSGMLVRGADIVLFVHREDDEDGVPGDEGLLLAAKVRNGPPGAMGVSFDASRMRFLPREREGKARTPEAW